MTGRAPRSFEGLTALVEIESGDMNMPVEVSYTAVEADPKYKSSSYVDIQEVLVRLHDGEFYDILGHLNAVTVTDISMQVLSEWRECNE